MPKSIKEFQRTPNCLRAPHILLWLKGLMQSLNLQTVSYKMREDLHQTLKKLWSSTRA